ncbi:hypothetical protein WICANDRAFT_64364 [Wickerhamomyces anomalus NRRL Y-366-8]|uniref:Uncharacterized protein n=1 Tax=Wickerhamomyces anomalus (strain ATCC 58044 / CBS 1984 / NCYC 433 / NRRL Y-366-8) TaxID=683960 RepID=A0A1E3NYV7_WICAA|nr:uncharacterized protein WICANDRAFT_64364 [Wickerhamomyces anomalus NRRL Y-366-8]ODQ58224.1 hypothetical protein WICANDRAFT_64364 [Wickerhamomyces anomalus NRRL Y-366-8]
MQTLTDYLSSLYKDDLISSNELSSSLLIISLLFFIVMVILSFSITIVFLFIKLYNCHEQPYSEKDEESLIDSPRNAEEEPRSPKRIVVIDVIRDDIYHEVNN